MRLISTFVPFLLLVASPAVRSFTAQCHGKRFTKPSFLSSQQRKNNNIYERSTTITSSSSARTRTRTETGPSTLSSLQMMEMDIPSSIITAVEVFDGSKVDPVVVSNVYWSSLQSKIISVVIGQALAAVAFAVISSLVSSQYEKIGDYVSKNIFNESVVKNNVSQFAENVKTRAQSPTVTPNFGKLLLCLAIDVVGSSSELVPIIGELTDFVWAPIAALSLRSLFQGSNVVFALEFAEEFLPFTDILPLATVCWVVETFYGDSSFAKTLRIGSYGKIANGDNKIIDVEPVDDQKGNIVNRQDKL